MNPAALFTACCTQCKDGEPSSYQVNIAISCCASETKSLSIQKDGVDGEKVEGDILQRETSSGIWKCCRFSSCRKSKRKGSKEVVNETADIHASQTSSMKS